MRDVKGEEKQATHSLRTECKPRVTLNDWLDFFRSGITHAHGQFRFLFFCTGPFEGSLKVKGEVLSIRICSFLRLDDDACAIMPNAYDFPCTVTMIIRDLRYAINRVFGMFNKRNVTPTKKNRILGRQRKIKEFKNNGIYELIDENLDESYFISEKR